MMGQSRPRLDVAQGRGTMDAAAHDEEEWLKLEGDRKLYGSMAGVDVKLHCGSRPCTWQLGGSDQPMTAARRQGLRQRQC